jgi:hypothetical protein
VLGIVIAVARPARTARATTTDPHTLRPTDRQEPESVGRTLTSRQQPALPASHPPPVAEGSPAGKRLPTRHHRSDRYAKATADGSANGDSKHPVFLQGFPHAKFPVNRSVRETAPRRHTQTPGQARLAVIRPSFADPTLLGSRHPLPQPSPWHTMQGSADPFSPGYGAGIAGHPWGMGKYGSNQQLPQTPDPKPHRWALFGVTHFRAGAYARTYTRERASIPANPFCGNAIVVTNFTIADPAADALSSTSSTATTRGSWL